MQCFLGAVFDKTVGRVILLWLEGLGGWLALYTYGMVHGSGPETGLVADVCCFWVVWGPAGVICAGCFAEDLETTVRVSFWFIWVSAVSS
jgi:hypothetical protein